MQLIPPTVNLTVYRTDGVRRANVEDRLAAIVEHVAAGRYRVSVDRVFGLEEIRDAHRHMEQNRACGKVVAVTGR